MEVNAAFELRFSSGLCVLFGYGKVVMNIHAEVVEKICLCLIEDELVRM